MLFDAYLEVEFREKVEFPDQTVCEVKFEGKIVRSGKTELFGSPVRTVSAAIRYSDVPASGTIDRQAVGAYLDKYDSYVLKADEKITAK